MNKIIPWVKANLGIVVLSALILLILPAGWVGSSMWNKSIRDARQKAVDADRGKLKGIRQITYAAKVVVPGERALEFPAPPNDKTIELFTQIRAEQDKQVAGVVESATQINSRGHVPLVEGLFPDPSEAERQAKVLAFMGAVVPTKDPANPSAYERLLAGIGAGGPSETMDVLDALNDAKQRELERIKAGRNAVEPSADEQKELTNTLVNQRLALYKQRAEQVSVFATMQIFPPLSNEVWPQIPDTRLTVPPSVTRCFAWQHDYWAVQDILEAVKRANTSGGRATMVPDSVVKRIERITLEAPPWIGGPTGDNAPTAVDPRNTLIPAVYSRSVTGRFGGKANQLYDVRNGRLTAVVSLARLPELINAISKTNFMTVIDTDIRQVDISGDLERGYYYGQEAVVRVDLEIETVWLRSWTTNYMPRSIKDDLGIASPEAEQPK